MRVEGFLSPITAALRIDGSMTGSISAAPPAVGIHQLPVCRIIIIIIIYRTGIDASSPERKIADILWGKKEIFCLVVKRISLRIRPGRAADDGHCVPVRLMIVSEIGSRRVIKEGARQLSGNSLLGGVHTQQQQQQQQQHIKTK